MLKEELMLMWIIVGLVAIPICILNPGFIVMGLFIYALVKLIKHYKLF